MDPKRGKSAFISNTVAPPADAPSLDIERLDKTFRNLDVSKTVPAKSSKGLDPSHKPSSSSASRTDWPSHKLSSSSSRRHEAVHQPSSSSSKRQEHPHQPSSRTQSSSTAKGPTKNPSQPTVRESLPPAYKTKVSGVKPSHSDGHNERSCYPEDKRSHVPSSRQTTERSQTIRQPSSHAASSRQQTERGYPDNKKSHQPSTHASSAHRQPSHTSSNSQKTTQQTGPGGTNRVRTENYPLGDMNRTFLEGVVTPSQYVAHGGSQHKTYPPTNAPRSMAPSSARTILINPDDVAMAKRQTQYTTLAPTEQKAQEKWAQSMITRTGSCPQGFAWRRIYDGYQCEGGHHIISDDLLAEGRGGIWGLDNPMMPHHRYGPYYAKADNPKLFLYAGPQPRPDNARGSFGEDKNSSSNQHTSTMNIDSRTVNIHGDGLHGSRMGPSLRMTGQGSQFHNPGHPSSRFPPGAGHSGSQFHSQSHGGNGHQRSNFNNGRSGI